MSIIIIISIKITINIKLTIISKWLTNIKIKIINIKLKINIKILNNIFINSPT